MAYGLIDSTYIDFAPGVDEAYLRGLTTRSGLRLTEIVARVDAAMGAINDGADPLVAALTFPTTRLTGPTNVVGVKTVTRKGEYTLERSQQIERRTHMLPIDVWEDAIGFTEDGLEEISLDSLDEELQAMVDAWHRVHRREVLERLFSGDEIPVAKGSTALSPGFAGSGTNDNVFDGNYPNGTPIDSSTYTHYGFAAEADIATAITTYRNRMRIWHRGPFDLIASQDVIDLILADTTNFVASGEMLVRPAPDQAQALVDAETYLGVYLGDIRVMPALSDFTDPNLALFRSYGSFSPQNPLAWVYDSARGREATIRDRSLYPMANAAVIQKFGVGVFNRTGAALIRIEDSSSEYVAPSIS